MRAATVVVAALVVTGLLGVVVVSLDDSSHLSERWVSDTGRDIRANHHAVVVHDGRVFAPVSGEAGTDGCSLVALDATNGTSTWSYPIPPSNCAVHAVADPTVADYDNDGTPNLLVAGDDGNVTLFDATGSITWRRQVDASVTWATTGDIDADDAREAFVATTQGDVVAFDGREGRVEWRRNVGRFAAVHALLDTDDDDGRQELYVTARDGTLRRVDVISGEIEWQTDLAAEDVQMMPPPVAGDVDGDGHTDLVVAGADGTVSVVSPNGTVRATYGRDMEILTHATLADVDDDGDDEMLVMYADGRVVALDYRSGDGKSR